MSTQQPRKRPSRASRAQSATPLQLGAPVPAQPLDSTPAPASAEPDSQPKKAPAQRSSAPARKRPVKKVDAEPAVSASTASAESSHHTSHTEVVSAQVTLRLPKALFARLAAHTEHTGDSMRAVILDAFEDLYPTLAGRYADPATGGGDGGLFGRSRTHHRKTAQEPVVTRSVSMTPSERNTINRIREEVGAPSRDQMIIDVLSTYLPEPKKRK